MVVGEWSILKLDVLMANEVSVACENTSIIEGTAGGHAGASGCESGGFWLRPGWM